MLTLQSCQKSDQHKVRRWHPVQDYLFQFYDNQNFRKISVEFTLENKIKFSHIFPILLSEQWQTLPYRKQNKILSNSCVALQHSQTFLANCTEGGDALGHRETDWFLLRLQHSPKSWPCHYAHLHWKWTEQGGFFFSIL